MTATDPKARLRDYLQLIREVLLWKLEGLGEYELRRPFTPTGTNLLGVVKHVAIVEAGYLGDVFGRPWPDPRPIGPGAEPNADMWATAEEPSQDIIEFYRRVWAHSDATIEALPLEATGQVPWWPPERREVTLHQILVHVIAETNRHAGQLDVIRELIDGTTGLRVGNENLSDGDQQWWADYRDRLERAARQAAC